MLFRSAAGNSSFSSNAVLFSGIRVDDLDQPWSALLRRPTLPQYAARANIAFGFFDAQDYRRLIWSARQACPPDSFTYVAARDDCPERYKRDLWLAQRLLEWLPAQKSSLTVFSKHGAHYPYEMDYPQSRKFFTPTVDGYAWSDDQAANRNSYDNAIRWAVDDFLEQLFTGLQQRNLDVIVIYSSDHGQVLPGVIPGRKQTHFGTDLPSESAEVPLFIWGAGAGADIVRRLRHNESLIDNSSHFEIFSTLLELIGYDPQDVRRLHGPSLFTNLPPKRIRTYQIGRAHV